MNSFINTNIIGTLSVFPTDRGRLTKKKKPYEEQTIVLNLSKDYVHYYNNMFYKKYGSSMSNSMQNIFLKKIIVVIFINLILHILAFFSYKYNLYLFSTFIRYFFAVSSILLLFY